MTTLLAIPRPRLDADALSLWLDSVGMPLVLAGAVMTMVATLAV